MARLAGEVSPELIGLAQAGDHRAIADLLRTTQPDIRRYARRTCRLQDIDDAVQETLTIVARRIAALRTPAAYIAWVFVMVSRECYRLAKRQMPDRQQLDDIENSLHLSQRSEADLRLDVTAAIHSLPAHYRLVLLLRDIEEMSIGEIAAQTAMTREAVKARLHRARLLVREYLAD